RRRVMPGSSRRGFPTPGSRCWPASAIRRRSRIRASSMRDWASSWRSRYDGGKHSWRLGASARDQLAVISRQGAKAQRRMPRLILWLFFAAQEGFPFLEASHLLLDALVASHETHRPRSDQGGELLDVESFQQSETEHLRHLLDGAVLLDPLLEAAERAVEF